MLLLVSVWSSLRPFSMGQLSMPLFSPYVVLMLLLTFVLYCHSHIILYKTLLTSFNSNVWKLHICFLASNRNYSYQH
jgi:hypothetical protein